MSLKPDERNGKGLMKKGIGVMSRAVFQDKGRKILEAEGMKVTLTGSRKKAPRGMVGFPDMIANGIDFTAYIEVKFGDDQLRPSQIAFREEILPLTGKHFVYAIATYIDDFYEVVQLYEQSKI